MEQIIRTEASGRYVYYCPGCYQGTESPIPVTEVAPDAACSVCYQPAHPCPFKVGDIVQINPMWVKRYGGGMGRRYVSIRNIYWCGNQYVIDTGQFLEEHPYAPEYLELTPVMVYMLPADVCRLSTRTLVPRPERTGMKGVAPTRKHAPTRRMRTSVVSMEPGTADDTDPGGDLDTHPF